MTVKRDFYLQQLIERKHNGLVKVITGVRRVGKSYLLFNLFKAQLLEDGVKPSEIVEIALEGGVRRVDQSDPSGGIHSRKGQGTEDALCLH